MAPGRAPRGAGSEDPDQSQSSGSSESPEDTPPAQADSGGEPWWNAGDDAYSGATPLFGGRRPRGDEHAPPPPPPIPDDVGTPISEALKLAGAVMRWSEESGLTDTLKQLASEAAEALASDAPPARMHGAGADSSAEDSELGDDSDQGTPNVTPITLHRWAAGESSGEGDGAEILVCDYCPLCRGLAVMRTVQPQVSGGLSEAMASLTAALDYAVEGFVRRQRSGDH